MLLLGNFVFEDFEIPEKVKGLLSGKHVLAVKRLIGGQRVIDAMGPDPADPAWSGRFQGGDIVARADQLAVMRDAGQPLPLICDAIALTVLIGEFNFDYERPYQGTYDIRLVVQPDASDVPPPSLDDVVGDGMNSANAILGGSVTGGSANSNLDAGSSITSGNLA